MSRVTISKKEYDALLEAKARYEYMRGAFEDVRTVFSPPPTKRTKTIVEAFEKTGTYNKRFLDGLRRGLERSKHVRS